MGRAKAQAVNRRPLRAGGRVQSQTRPHAICGGPSRLGKVLLRVLPKILHTNSFVSTYAITESVVKNNKIHKTGNVHSCQQKSIGLKFSKSQTGSDVRYSCHHTRNSSRFTFPILRIRAVSLSSIHYNQSHRVYINRRRQYICLI